MRTLKILVIGMGILLVLGVGLLFWGVARQAGRLADASWGKSGLGQTAGTKVQEMVAAGRYVVVRVAADGGERLLVLDPATGALVGEWRVTEPR
jgi:hypothetical protein